MSTCDMCGREDRLVLVELEGSQLNVCSNCGKHGKRVGAPAVKKGIRNFKPRKIEKVEIEEEVVVDFAVKLRKAREKRGLKQKEFADLLNEKESLLQKWEAGSLIPKINVAKKLERMLGMNFVIQIKDAKEAPKLESTAGEMTLGDFIKFRKRI